jgi:hypothetical protein|tara:strand:- start:65 stop:298 length:234 start_codon:yes stop_codon:yes gene_type:complete
MESKMTIYEIKELTKETAPYFFSKDTMKFFGQTLKDFRVKKQDDGRYKITAPSGSNWEHEHTTVRFFNPENNELELK